MCIKHETRLIHDTWSVGPFFMCVCVFVCLCVCVFVFLVYLWCIYGVFMVYLWCVCVFVCLCVCVFVCEREK